MSFQCEICESCRTMQQEQCKERHHTAHVEAESIRLLALVVGPHDSQDIPREIRRHQWSALNVLLLWSAAEGDFDNPVVRWLVEESERVPTVIVGSDVKPQFNRHGVGVVEGCVAFQRG